MRPPTSYHSKGSAIQLTEREAFEALRRARERGPVTPWELALLVEAERLERRWSVRLWRWIRAAA